VSLGGKSLVAPLEALRPATWPLLRPLTLSAAPAYIQGFEIERFYRDAKIGQIYESTNQIQRSIRHRRPGQPCQFRANC
jgi:alkylation response protein AidB-like acyl-CoA dehydrogenase